VSVLSVSWQMPAGIMTSVVRRAKSLAQVNPANLIKA
jgi:hypothetical protein